MPVFMGYLAYCSSCVPQSLTAAFQGVVHTRLVCPQIREILNCVRNARLPDVNRGDLRAETGLSVVAQTHQAMVACLFAT